MKGAGLDEGKNPPWRAGPVVAALWQRGPGGAMPLSQARHAQTLILALLRARGIDRPVVALPAYYEKALLAPLFASPAELRYYAVTPELAPDWQRLEAGVAQSGPPHVFILVHYYGTEADGAAARSFADRHGALLFEDAAHTMLPAGTIGRYGDLACYSPRKYYGSADGAVLVARGEALAAELDAIAPAIPSAWIPRPFHGLKSWGDRALPWRRKTGPLPPRGFDEDWAGVPGASSAVWMSAATSRLIERLGPEGAEAIRQREVADTSSIEGHVERATPLRAMPRRPEVAPYLLGFRGRNRAETEAAYHLLRQAGANSIPWPNLPTEVRAAPERFGATQELRNTIFVVTPRFVARRPALDFIRRLPAEPA